MSSNKLSALGTGKMFSRAWDNLDCQIGYIFSLLADWLHGVLTVYTNYLGGNLVHKRKTIKFDVLGEEPVTKYIEINCRN